MKNLENPRIIIPEEPIAKNIEGLSDVEPFATFSVNTDKDYQHTIRIIALIPTKVGKNFNVSGPDAKEIAKTYLGDISTRMITISWDETHPSTSPHNIWSITIHYNVTEEISDLDDVIKVLYKFEDGYPKTPRGTVTTTVKPKVVGE